MSNVLYIKLLNTDFFSKVIIDDRFANFCFLFILSDKSYMSYAYFGAHNIQRRRHRCQWMLKLVTWNRHWCRRCPSQLWEGSILCLMPPEPPDQFSDSLWHHFALYNVLQISGIKFQLHFFFFFLLMSAPTAYGSYQARSCICKLSQSSQQCWILNPLTEARDWTQILTETTSGP